jgi:hypothetical protein
VLHELTLITSDTTVEHLASHVLQNAIGELCMRRDRAAISTLATLVKSTCGGVVERYSPLIISHGLWQAGTSSTRIIEVQGSMIHFLEQLLAEDRAGATLDEVLRRPTMMHCTKLETIYLAAHVCRWSADGFATPEDTRICRLFLETLLVLEATSTEEDSGDRMAGAPLRKLLPVETVEFFVQLFGSALRAGASQSHCHGSGAPRPGTALAQGQQVSQVSSPTSAVVCGS